MRCTDWDRLPDKENILCRQVETFTRDLSPLYTKAGEELFFNSSGIADTFHIIRLLTEACQAVRVRFRQDVLSEKRLNDEAHPFGTY
jgi:transposase